ncbi:YceI family protein [Christiangramia aquimixticola]|uniref:YceI family protein n=1 Tax=Christiangramia aquimixticola TaxID=1697558 RepID=UPI003AA8EFFD
MRGVSLIILVIFFCGASSATAQFYQTTTAHVSFYSSAPVEDIEAVSTEGISVINADNGTISFKVKMRSFQFEKGLMQEHFNENYVESEIYPHATFKGEFLEKIDLQITGSQENTIKGTFTVHGVSKEREIPVILNVLDGGQRINLSANFQVACEAHKIKIPKILWKNIAEIIEVNVNADFQFISK